MVAIRTGIDCSSASVEGDEGGAGGSSNGSVRFRVVTLLMISSGGGKGSVAWRVKARSTTLTRSVGLRVVTLRINGSCEASSPVSLRVETRLMTGSGDCVLSVDRLVMARCRTVGEKRCSQ